MLRARRRDASSKRSFGSWFRRQHLVTGALLAAVGAAVVLRVKASTGNEGQEAGLPVVDISTTDQSTSVPAGATPTQRATAAAQATSTPTPPAEATAPPAAHREAQATAQPEIEATPLAAEATAQTAIEATPRPEPEATPQTEAQPTTQTDAEATAQPETQAEPVVGRTESSAPRQPAPAPPPPPRTIPRPVGYRTYTVQRGDILKQIAARYGVSMASIMAINSIPNPDSLRIGQVLTIPPPGS